MLHLIPRMLNKENQKILQLGVGSSSLFEEFAKDPLFPANTQVTNIDINQTVIDWMNHRQSFVSFFFLVYI